MNCIKTLVPLYNKIHNAYLLEKQGRQNPTEVRTTGYWNVQDIEQKPAEWSKEDEKIISKLIAVVELYYGIGDDLDKQRCLSWLKSLKPRN